VIVLEQTTEPLSIRNAAVAVRWLRERHDQSVVQALMVAFVMIMRRELTQRSSERCFPDENDPVQT
jgi:hypothetical protein